MSRVRLPSPSALLKDLPGLLRGASQVVVVAVVVALVMVAAFFIGLRLGKEGSGGERPVPALFATFAVEHAPRLRRIPPLRARSPRSPGPKVRSGQGGSTGGGSRDGGSGARDSGSHSGGSSGASGSDTDKEREGKAVLSPEAESPKPVLSPDGTANR